MFQRRNRESATFTVRPHPDTGRARLVLGACGMPVCGCTFEECSVAKADP